jgi:hypothetical protein
MSGKWFSNRGQVLQVGIAVVALGIAIIVALPALAQHPNLLSWSPIILIPAIALGAFSFGKNYATSRPSIPVTPTSTSAPPISSTMPPKAPSKASMELIAAAMRKEEAFETTVNIYTSTLKMGSFWQDEDTPRRIRVTANVISDEPEPRVELLFGMGALAHGGTQTKRTKTNQFLMRAINSGFQAEEYCVYCFSYDEKHVWFFVVRVDHINKHANEIILSICKVSSFKRAG